MDYENLSQNALEIFIKMQPYFPPDPWNNPRWIPEGKVYQNGWHDLRKRVDRNCLMEHIKSAIGYAVGIIAAAYRNTHGSLSGFAAQPFSPMIQHDVELLLLLKDLDFQIETLDFVKWQIPPGPP